MNFIRVSVTRGVIVRWRADMVEGRHGGGAGTGGFGEMTGLEFRGSGALKKKKNSDGH
jgi:hypothetical protein